MSCNFTKYERKIKQCLHKMDLNYFIEDLRDLFTPEKIKHINESDQNEKTDVFFNEFKSLKKDDKFKAFQESASRHNKWVHSFLSVDLNNPNEVCQLDAKWIVLENILDLLRRSKYELCVMNESLINQLYSTEIVTKGNRDYLLTCLRNYGEEYTLFEFFNVVSTRDTDWYGRFLFLISRQKTAFIEIIKEDMIESNGEPTKEDYNKYANDLISRHMSKLKIESIIDDASSDYVSDNGLSVDGDQDNDALSLSDEEGEEIERVELKLKNFQLELSEVALNGENVIIYAPTGTGKTVVAVHVANEHLKNNPNGKVAFLVPRTPLVTQQYRTFEKFKSHDYNVMEMRGRSDTVCGPLIVHMDSFQVFVMTSDILRNALTIDDGNKLSSICQFSLIFFDECHNCMKSHPYTNIMKEYFKVKKNEPNRKLPQIVGLTASPRSNKKDDVLGMQKSLFELCANLDCVNFSMVKQNIKELEEEMTQPKQEVIKIGARKVDEFETTLIRVMGKIEEKLTKMKNEGYFSPGACKPRPDNKFEQEYVGFVGNLEKLSTFTNSENDGKQKAYSIYRYLNAYYRGLIVNQMFDESYALDTIHKYLKHSGSDFTCCYDEEFYYAYKDEIVVRQQSENPSIERIKTLIQKQLSEKPDSRILIFVRQVDYTYYLVDVLKQNNINNAEAIVGSNTKNNLKGCTINEMNEIIKRFTKGDTKVLVATTVVEEGLDVGLCNMVISYGHVTNETALIQRRGRARASDSKYILVLPPMLAWLEKKELLNERRKGMMMELIAKFGQINTEKRHMNLFIVDYQQRNFFIDKKKAVVSNPDKVSWNFKCKKCQELICTSEEIRIVENMHRVCMNPQLLTKYTICRREIQAFGSQGSYEIAGVIKCICQNSELGNFMLYKKVPYFQINVTACNIESSRPKDKTLSLKKWKDFSKHYTINNLSKEELERYLNEVESLEPFLELIN